MSHTDTNPLTPPSAELGYDRSEPKAGLIFWMSASVVGFLFFLILGVYWLYVNASETVEYQQFSGVASQELQAIHDREEQNLHRYSYIDKDKGVVRIPIEKAMQIVADEFQAGKVGYNTTTYDVKPEPLGGAAASLTPGAVAPAAGAPAESGAKTENAQAPAGH